MPTENENQEASWLDKAKAVARVAAPYAYNAAKNLLPFPARMLAEGVEAADNGTLGLGPALASGALQQPVREALGMPGKQIDESYFSPDQLEVLKRATALHIASRGQEKGGVVDGYAANESMGEYHPKLEHQGNSNKGYWGAITNNPLDLLPSTIGSYGYKQKDNGDYVGHDTFDFSPAMGSSTTNTAFGPLTIEAPLLRKIAGLLAPENDDGSSRSSATEINVNLGNLDRYIENAKNAIDPNEDPRYYAGQRGSQFMHQKYGNYYEQGYPHAKALDYRKPLK